MKLNETAILFILSFVAPFAGAWIEIRQLLQIEQSATVAPFAGAWIEILLCDCLMGGYASLPSRERGLK